MPEIDASSSPTASPIKDEGVVKRFVGAFKRKTHRLNLSTASMPTLQRGKSTRSEFPPVMEMPDDETINSLYMEAMRDICGEAMLNNEKVKGISRKAKWQVVMGNYKQQAASGKFPPKYFLERLKPDSVLGKTYFLDKETVSSLRIQLTSQPIS